MKRNDNPILPIPVEPELKHLVKEAAEKTRLSQADVMRSALRIGVPELVRRLEVRPRPRRNLVEYIDAFGGLLDPKRKKEMVAPSRFV